MRRISKRLEALERAADKELFADSLPFAIAYYLGGARNLSEVAHAYAKALGYKILGEFVEASAYLFGQQPASLNRAVHEARIHQARIQLLSKFGYARLRPAALIPAYSSIVRTLPKDWLAAIKSAHSKDCEDEARANQFLKNLMERAEKCQRSATRRRQGDPRQSDATQ
jgi:hypothetical protein